MHRLFKKLIMLVVMLPLLLAACGTSGSSTTSTPSGSCPASRANLKCYVVTHGQSTDPFWSVVKKGVDQAAHDMCVTAHYEAPTGTTFDESVHVVLLLKKMQLYDSQKITCA